MHSNEEGILVNFYLVLPDFWMFVKEGNMYADGPSRVHGEE